MLIRRFRPAGLRQNPSSADDFWNLFGGRPDWLPAPAPVVPLPPDPSLLVTRLAASSASAARREERAPTPGLLVSRLAATSSRQQALDVERAAKEAQKAADAILQAQYRLEKQKEAEERALQESRVYREKFKRLQEAAEARKAAEASRRKSQTVLVSGLAKLKLVGQVGGTIVTKQDVIVPVRMTFVLDYYFDVEFGLIEEDELPYADESELVGLWTLETLRVSGRNIPAHMAEVQRVESEADRLIKKELFITAPTHIGTIEFVIRHGAIKKYLAPREAAEEAFGADDIMPAPAPADAYLRAVKNLDLVSAGLALDRCKDFKELFSIAEANDLPLPDGAKPPYVKKVLLAAAAFTIALDTGNWKQARDALKKMTRDQLISVGLSTNLYDPDIDGEMLTDELRDYLLLNIEPMQAAAAQPPTPADATPPLEVVPGSDPDAVAMLDTALASPAAIMASQVPTPVVVVPEVQEDSGVVLPVAAVPAPVSPPPVELPVDVYGIYRTKGQAGLSKALGKLYLPELKTIGRALIPGFDQMRVNAAPEASQLIIEHVRRTA